MAVVLYLSYGDTSAVDFQADGCQVRDGFYPVTAANAETPVTEQVEVMITGTAAARVAKIHATERLFDLAKAEASGAKPVWVNYAVDASADVQRALVLDGAVVQDDKLTKRWAGGKVRVRISVKRDPVWEALTWAALPLSNGNGTNNTTGLRVINCMDGAGASPNINHNYVQIAAASVAGSQPAPVKLQMTPEEPINGITICHDADLRGLGWRAASPPATYEIIEGEDLSAAGGVVVADAKCSGGELQQVTLPTTLGLFAQGAMFMTYAAGYYRFYLRLRGMAPAGTWAKVRVRSADGGLVTMNETPIVLLSTTRRLQTMGILQLPPGPRLDSPGGYFLELYGYNAAGGVLEVDYIAWHRVTGYQEISESGTGTVLPPDWRMVEEFGTERKSYLETTGVGIGQFRFFNQFAGGGLYLVPNIDQRLHFGMRDGVDDLNTDLGMSMLVKAWYKPRRLTL